MEAVERIVEENWTLGGTTLSRASQYVLWARECTRDDEQLPRLCSPNCALTHTEHHVRIFLVLQACHSKRLIRVSLEGAGDGAGEAATMGVTETGLVEEYATASSFSEHCT